MGWCSALGAQQGGRPGPASSCQPEFHTHHSGTKRATGRIQTTTNTPRQFLSRLAGRVTEVRRRRGETNGARRDRRGFGCRKRWNCSCSFSGDSECYGGWPQASNGIRIDRELAVVLLVARVYFWGRLGRGLWLWRPFWRAAFGGCPLVYLIAATGVAQITNASPEIGCWGWTLGTVPDWDGPFFRLSLSGAASRQQWTPRCSQLSYDAIWLVRDSGLGKAGCQFFVWCWWCRRRRREEKVDDRTSCASRDPEQRQIFSSPTTVLTNQGQPTHLKDGWDGMEKGKRGTRRTTCKTEQRQTPRLPAHAIATAAVQSSTTPRGERGRVDATKVSMQQKREEGKMEKGTTLACCPWVRAVLCLRGCTLQSGSGLHPFPIGLVDAVL